MFRGLQPGAEVNIGIVSTTQSGGFPDSTGTLECRRTIQGVSDTGLKDREAGKVAILRNDTTQSGRFPDSIGTKERVREQCRGFPTGDWRTKRREKRQSWKVFDNQGESSVASTSGLIRQQCGLHLRPDKTAACPDPVKRNHWVWVGQNNQAITLYTCSPEPKRNQVPVLSKPRSPPPSLQPGGRPGWGSLRRYDTSQGKKKKFGLLDLLVSVDHVRGCHTDGRGQGMWNNICSGVGEEGIMGYLLSSDSTDLPDFCPGLNRFCYELDFRGTVRDVWKVRLSRRKKKNLKLEIYIYFKQWKMLRSHWHSQRSCKE